MNVFITGVSGYIGGKLLGRLDADSNVQKVIGVDIRPPRAGSPKLVFHQRDVSLPFGDCLSAERVDSAVHLAFVLKPTRDRGGASRTDVTGAANFLEACLQAGVKHLLCLSSHTVYGAHPDNGSYLAEDAPLRPMPGFQYSWDKAQAEAAFRDFARAHPEVALTVLRCVPVIGPNAAGSIAASMFPRTLVRVAGYDPMFQFVQEDDLLDLLVACIRRRQDGVFNVAADDGVRYSSISSLCGRPMLALPALVLRPAIAMSWALHLQNESPPSGLDFIRYPPLVSVEKLKREMGFVFGHSSEQALRTYFERGK